MFDQLIFCETKQTDSKIYGKEKNYAKEQRAKNSQKILEKHKRRGFALPDVELILKL